MVAWGNKLNGGDCTAVADKLSGRQKVRQIYSTHSAFAAVFEDVGGIVTWGHKDFGGDFASAALRESQKVSKISSTFRAFAAILEDGGLVAWGDKDSGGNCEF